MIIPFTTNAARSNAISYMRSELEKDKSLSNLLLKSVNVEAGDFVALSAQKLESSEIDNLSLTNAIPRLFESETLSVNKHPNIHKELASIIHEYLSNGAHACLLQNSLALKDDPWLGNAKSRIIFYRQEVYHLILPSSSPTEILDAIRESSNGVQFVGAIFWGGVGISNDLISSTDLEEIVRTTRSIIVSAFDGEGYLIWNSDWSHWKP
jgi:hypothetical protein